MERLSGTEVPAAPRAGRDAGGRPGREFAVMAGRRPIVGRRDSLQCRAERARDDGAPHAQFAGQEAEPVPVLSPVRSLSFTVSLPTVIIGVSPLNDTADACPVLGTPFASV